MSSTASECGYTLLFNELPKGSGEELAKNAKSVCEKLIDLQVSGVLFMPFELPPHLLPVNAEIADRLTAAGITVVLIDRDIYPPTKRSKYDIVAIDHEKAAFILTLHLIDLGWKRIDFISYNFSAAMTQRLAGYQNALRLAKLPDESSRIHTFENVTNLEAINEIIKKLDTDAIVCVNDDIAILMINQMRQLGIRVPEDIRVVGFDDSPALAQFHIPLTTVRQPIRTLGAEAVRAIIARKTYPDEPARTITIATELVIRDTCGAKMPGKV
jgi:LacI family transcriptional regulator